MADVFLDERSLPVATGINPSNGLRPIGDKIESRDEGVTLSNGDRGAVHSLTLTRREQSAVTLQAMTTSKPSDKKMTVGAVTP